MIKAVIIDDDITTLEGITDSVRWNELGVRVAGTAKNGKEGLEQIRAHQPDIILTDIYMPVMDGIQMLKAVREEGNSAEVVILSGYEDFKYAQSAVKLQVNDYLSKPATLDEIEAVLKETADKVRSRTESAMEDLKLRELLEDNLPLTRKQVFKGLLEPGFCETAFFRKVKDYLKLDLNRQYFTVIAIEFSINRDRADYKPSDFSLFVFAVNNIAEEFASSKKGVYVADLQRNFVTMLVSTPAEVKKEYVSARVKHTARELVETIRGCLKVPAWATLGSVAETTAGIPKSYQEAVNLLAQREHAGDLTLICQEDMAKLPKHAPRCPIKNYQAITDAVVSGNFDTLESRVEELILALHEESAAPGSGVLRKYAIDLMGILALALHDQGLQMEDIHSGFNMYKELDKLYSISDFASWLRELLMPVCEIMQRRGSQKHRKTIDFILKYVKEHYAEDITLDVLAEKVYLTRNYLSQIFKQETGENYNSFVTRVRMEKAKELMLSGNYKLYEISQMVGYKNNAYFSQLFKKYIGVYPSEFNQ